MGNSTGSRAIIPGIFLYFFLPNQADQDYHSTSKAIAILYPIELHYSLSLKNMCVINNKIDRRLHSGRFGQSSTDEHTAQVLEYLVRITARITATSGWPRLTSKNFKFVLTCMVNLEIGFKFDFWRASTIFLRLFAPLRRWTRAGLGPRGPLVGHKQCILAVYWT